MKLAARDRQTELLGAPDCHDRDQTSSDRGPSELGSLCVGSRLLSAAKLAAALHMAQLLRVGSDATGAAGRD